MLTKKGGIDMTMEDILRILAKYRIRIKWWGGRRMLVYLGDKCLGLYDWKALYWILKTIAMVIDALESLDSGIVEAEQGDDIEDLLREYKSEDDKISLL